MSLTAKQVLVLFFIIKSGFVTCAASKRFNDDVSLVLRVGNGDTDNHVIGSRSKRDTSNSGAVTMTNLQVVSTIQSHYAKTIITSVMENGATSGNGTETSFMVQIPEEAFISSFNMEINGTWYASSVLSKAEAKKIYDAARNQSQNAGMVSSAGPSGSSQETVKYRKKFNVNTNIAPGSRVTFVLTYEELLERKLGKYDHIISVRPNQTVANLTIAVDIDEPQGLTSLEVDEPSLPQASVQSVSSMVKKIQYSPTVAQQQAQNAVKGIDGDFIVTYVLQDTNNGGVILVGNGGYFVQYIAPTGLNALPKSVYFVVDVSGSMSGQKIEQAKNAMLAILDQLDTSMDYFGIVLFDDTLEYWPDTKSLVQATSERISSAKSFANEKIKARGGTDINSGLVAASQALKNQPSSRASIIVFLTDGQPTSGVYDTKVIRQNILQETSGTGIGIFSIGFGTGVNSDFMRAVSYENCGRYQFIADDAEASKELENFFRQLGSPLIKGVQVEYSNNLVDQTSLSNTTKCLHFSGSEMVVVGKLQSPTCPSSWQSRVTGQGKTTNIDLYSSAATCTNEAFLERLWAYKKINSLLDQMNALSDNDVLKKEVEAKALNMSLEYNFVTPLTSMVVVQSADYQVRNQEDLFIQSFGGRINSKSTGITGSRSSTKCLSLVLFVAVMSYMGLNVQLGF
ncbi:inter-alpha-trypsin inhibitor heavy chain H4 [Lingula anatina]|uniref:Inter-alpha-trypsin inhibitor heavy chain H4 n=1 Tax=Lingula anatina TaxID=7574 RepID=A0A1S3H1U8_LINAN|nr:inter-alpha-trypsin inhibitor heavy chain H4 [Lingula anatina]|eukprot:XP_013380100.1 inter-alpha-trypsin inhibitor heavy chain H4 [Lingula anatina]